MFERHFCTAFISSQFEFVIFWQNEIGPKPARKMLVKLTLGLLGREQPEIAARKSVRYIAAQGPGEETTPLFWEMIWQQVIRGQFK